MGGGYPYSSRIECDLWASCVVTERWSCVDLDVDPTVGLWRSSV